MICPDCNGTGRVPKRFLLFFTRRARCPKCRGTGEFPPRVTRPGRAAMPMRDDDRDTWTPRSGYDGTSEASSRVDRFQVGGGGRSGGAGGGASWGDASDNAPLIVDPFADGSSPSAKSDADADAVGPDLDASSGSAASDEDSSGSADGGTSY
jgi:hypothetical protein